MRIKVNHHLAFHVFILTHSNSHFPPCYKYLIHTKYTYFLTVRSKAHPKTPGTVTLNVQKANNINLQLLLQLLVQYIKKNLLTVKCILF